MISFAYILKLAYAVERIQCSFTCLTIKRLYLPIY